MVLVFVGLAAVAPFLYNLVRVPVSSSGSPSDVPYHGYVGFFLLAAVSTLGVSLVKR
jgi:hypothetical protein